MLLSSNTALTIAKYAFGATATGSALVVVGLWYFQRSLIYPAYLPEGSRTQIPSPLSFGLAFEDVTLTTPDAVKIKAFVIPARSGVQSTSQNLMGLTPKERNDLGGRAMEELEDELKDDSKVQWMKSRPTVVIFHANAGNMGHRLPLARKFNVDFGCNVFMLSYRGYGQSEGTASEQGIRIDVETALQHIAKHPILGSTKLVLYGQSIGGAVSLWAGANHPKLVSGIILENTFYSLESLIPSIMPQIPQMLLPALLTERWDSHLAMAKVPVDTPLLMISGKQDELVPPRQMVQLKELRESKQGKLRWKLVDGGHNDTCMSKGYWDEIGDWLRQEIDSDTVRSS